ncbi:DUF5610 domain-containing protein [Bermanella marisrubri]|uniref:Putative orphan protein n=1 Tax=Bermanella marisrubri TaxID=207949 RepID=Q1N662_9GAMM|nr:DUF5610 domain-containing protein [Bermanella marisrubri]EAT13730.1 putative orphan protein [Oceanobacter sp. RED65] [Bermanella marisrubri]QIZ84506.1 DUF5610 domain-containing protein [Bermanella marisrubri]
MLSFNSSFFNQSTLYSQTIKPQVQPNAYGQEKTEQDQFAMQRLGENLKKNADVDLASDKTVNEATKPFDVDVVIDTVMKQIGKRIDEAKSAGASDKELESMFEAARSGVEKGFGQAREQIEALSKMNEPLAEKIDAAENGIYEGIDQLKENTFASQNVKDAVKTEQSSFEYGRVFQQARNDFNFELTTQEGDKVTIKANSQFESYAAFMKAQSESGQTQVAGVSQSMNSGYSLSVEGDISEAEMAAIEDLMSQVNSLSEEFYGGDLDKAFDMAMGLTSDASQIAEFSLNLRQQQTQAVEYGKGVSGYNQESLPKGLSEPLADFANSVQQAFDKAKFFQNSQELLAELTEKMQPKPEESKTSMLDFMKPLMDKLAA